MTSDNLIEYSKSQIICDCVSLSNYLFSCISTRQHPGYYATLLLYLNLFVGESEKFCKDNNLSFGNIKNPDLKKFLNKFRSKSNKLYIDMTIDSLKSIEEFNESEYQEFSKYYKEPNKCNYNIFLVNQYPICNYHLLCKKILGFSVGLYSNFYDKLSNHMFNLLSYIFDKNLLSNQKLSEISLPKFDMKVSDINTHIDYDNFRIKDKNINFAFMDVVCIINYYKLIFKRINTDRVLDLKIKYITLCNTILSLDGIVNFCINNEIVLPYELDFHNYIVDLKNNYVRNLPRKVCMHYNYEKASNFFKSDPVIEAFEMGFDDEINNVVSKLDFVIDELFTNLNKYVFIKEIKVLD